MEAVVALGQALVETAFVGSAAVVPRAEEHAVGEVGASARAQGSSPRRASHQAAGIVQPSATHRRSRIASALRRLA